MFTLLIIVKMIIALDSRITQYLKRFNKLICHIQAFGAFDEREPSFKNLIIIGYFSMKFDPDLIPRSCYLRYIISNKIYILFLKQNF